MIEIVPFCSSSKGNSVYIGDEHEGVLIDAGCSYKRLKCFMEICGVNISSVKAILVTHGHSDHTKGLKQLTKQTGIPVFASAGTVREIISGDNISNKSKLHDLSDLNKIQASLYIKAFPTSHDSAESTGFTIEYDKNILKIGYCTDTGKITNAIKEKLTGVNTVFIESNYEPSLLRSNTKYPYYLKKRIESDLGHLSNPDCAKFISYLANSGTSKFILGHLSEENNCPEFAYENAFKSLSEFGMKEGEDYELSIAPAFVAEKTLAGNFI